jgi:hypothetical protein
MPVDRSLSVVPIPPHAARRHRDSGGRWKKGAIAPPEQPPARDTAFSEPCAIKALRRSAPRCHSSRPLIVRSMCTKKLSYLARVVFQCIQRAIVIFLAASPVPDRTRPAAVDNTCIMGRWVVAAGWFSMCQPCRNMVDGRLIPDTRPRPGPDRRSRISLMHAHS